jgi:hypothetical protein
MWVAMAHPPTNLLGMYVQARLRQCRPHPPRNQPRVPIPGKLKQENNKYMASIGNFDIAPSEPLDLNDYPTIGGKKERKFPNKGRYTLRATDSFTEESFAPNKANTALTFAINPVIVGPTNEGYQLKFNSGRISGKVYQRKGRPASQLGDYLKSVGVDGVVPGDPQAQADIVESTAGMTFEAGLDWRAYDKSTGRSVEGMENFPSDGQGGHLPYLLSETEKDENGDAKKIWANVEIVYFVPAGQ